MARIPDSWRIEKLAGALGAEVVGPDIKNFNDKDIEAIKSLLSEHLVLFMPGQSPSVEEHIRFGSCFGKLEGHPNYGGSDDLPSEIFHLANGVADVWHTDITFQEQPALLSILHALSCPEAGGDTMWSNMYTAYDELSDPLKSLCDGLTALHDASPHGHPEKATIHPVVRVNPETGAKALYVNKRFTRRIVEVNGFESDMLLAHLTSWCTNPRFTVRYKWSPGTVAMWDNRFTQHMVLNDFTGERVMQRVTVVGDQVEGAGNSQWQAWERNPRLSSSIHLDRQLDQQLKSRKQSVDP